MSYPLRKEEYHCNYVHADNISGARKIRTKTKKKKKSFLALLFSLIILSAYGYYVCPYNYNNYLRPIFLNRFLNRNIKPNIAKLFPTKNYIYNSFIVDKNISVISNNDSKEIAEITIINQMTSTKDKLTEMFKKYPDLKPSVFVWEYSTGSGLEINSNELYPSASIIKIPIAYELIRLVDQRSNTPSPISLDDKRMFTELFRTSGSGDLQKSQAGKQYSLDYLANIMIANSDNSATNMILYEIGGMDNFNRSMRNYGLKNVSMQNWLPDLEGTNKITAREISEILYNIDNPHYINPKYKNILKEYLGNTRNIHLIREKLPADVMVFHKTGDIESMLGDAGIVYTNNGKKYIVTILVKRPKNSQSAKILIQDVSKVIFDDIKNLQ